MAACSSLSVLSLSSVPKNSSEIRVRFSSQRNSTSVHVGLYGNSSGRSGFAKLNAGTFWGVIADDFKAVEPPSGFQGLISWPFLQQLLLGWRVFVHAAVFATIFTIIELDKPDQPHNFEPEIYNMERGARDKLINDYNTMSIWEFNEKYGHLWDFTLKDEQITKA
ncbi:hypothetical protein Q3G72_032279 [Acer saccharum]|nr:hypothetical protein Q3G72_032279 [Acer saccharum]